MGKGTRVKIHRPSSAELGDAIKDEAWKQISAAGAAALSLRAIGRALGITAPAIYNYFHRRDDLVTALIVDAYTDFADSQRAAVGRVDPADHAGRLAALGIAYRGWAVANPERYQLMFGAPYPGYRVPAQVVGPVAGRALGVLVGVLEEARLAGVLVIDETGRGSGPLQPPAGLAPERLWELYGSSDPAVLQAAVTIWARVHGPVAIELAGQYPPFVGDPERVYRLELDAMVHATVR
jgi:AcrR family transcriptional regulator